MNSIGRSATVCVSPTQGIVHPLVLTSVKMLNASVHTVPVCLHLPTRAVELGCIRARNLLPRSTLMSQRPNSQGRHKSLNSTASHLSVSTLPPAERQQGQVAELDALCAFAGSLLPPLHSSNGDDSGFLELDGSEQRALLDKARPDHQPIAKLERSFTDQVLAQARQAMLLKLPWNARKLVQR